jgi:molybdopterin converting factor small subunit
MVEVEFNLMLAELAGKKRDRVEISCEMSLEEFIGHVGLKADDVGMQLINKEWAPFESRVHDGDYVQLFPWLEGG